MALDEKGLGSYVNVMSMTLTLVDFPLQFYCDLTGINFEESKKQNVLRQISV